MFYNVVIRDNDYLQNEFYNQLVFTFYELDEAIKFESLILKTSNYCVEIIQIEETGE